VDCLKAGVHTLFNHLCIKFSQQVDGILGLRKNSFFSEIIGENHLRERDGIENVSLKQKFNKYIIKM
jgi:hypothetical protein